MQAFNANGGNDKLSWTSEDPRESVIFGPWGVLYRFTHDAKRNATECLRTSHNDREDRVAKFEWAANGQLGFVVIGRTSIPMSEMCKQQFQGNSAYRTCVGSDGLHYRWAPSTNGLDIVLQDSDNNTIASMHPIRPTRYPVGTVHYEFRFYRNGHGGALLPPVMDMAVISAMLYRYCLTYNL